MKIWMIGAPGSGKTTVARGLSRELGIPAYELDHLFWLPGWRIAPREDLVAGVARLVAQEGWIIDGNYPAAAPLLNDTADLLLWFDLPFPLTYWRVLSRTAQRLVRGEEVCNGNRETLRNLFHRDGMPAYALLKHRRNQARYRGFWDAFPRQKLRLTRPRQVMELARQACRGLPTGRDARAG